MTLTDAQALKLLLSPPPRPSRLEQRLDWLAMRMGYIASFGLIATYATAVLVLA